MGTLSVTDGTTTLSLSASPYLVDGERSKWGDFELTDRFKRWIGRGKRAALYPFGEWHNPAVHTLPVVVTGSVDDLDAIMRPGSMLIAFDGVNTRTASILAVDRSEPVHFPSHSEVTYAVTTRLWCSTPIVTIPDTQPTSCFGVVRMDGIGGNAPALVEHRMVPTRITGDPAYTFCAIGVVPGADATFNPAFDITGAATNAAYVGGSADSTTVGVVANAFSQAALVTFDTSKFRGDCMAFLRCGVAAAVQTTWRCDSVVSGSGLLTASETTVTGETALAAASGALAVLPMGPLPVPAADSRYSGGTGTVYGSPVLDIQQDTGTSHGIYDGEQTFTVVTSGVLSAISIVTDAFSHPIAISVYRYGVLIGRGQISSGSGTASLHKVAITRAALNNDGLEQVIGGDVAVSEGETLTMVVYSSGQTIYYSSSSVYAGGARTGGGDLRFRVYVRPLSLVGTGIDIQAAAPSSVAALADALCVMPVNGGALLVNRSFPSYTGILVDAMDEDPQGAAKVYEYAENGASYGIGQALEGEWFAGPQPRLCPGDNAVVLACGAPANAPAGMLYWNTRIERFVRPYGDS